mmetsp:Transcript_4883/g.15996  ORF Transcript_4883/g.15996 Transcript_4883/m.15996 type:complete len:400 (+) Transcript_4883:78-1277(+)
MVRAVPARLGRRGRRGPGLAVAGAPAGPVERLVVQQQLGDRRRRCCVVVKVGSVATCVCAGGWDPVRGVRGFHRQAEAVGAQGGSGLAGVRRSRRDDGPLEGRPRRGVVDGGRRVGDPVLRLRVAPRVLSPEFHVLRVAVVPLRLSGVRDSRRSGERVVLRAVDPRVLAVIRGPRGVQGGHRKAPERGLRRRREPRRRPGNGPAALRQRSRLRPAKSRRLPPRPQVEAAGHHARLRLRREPALHRPPRPPPNLQTLARRKDPRRTPLHLRPLRPLPRRFTRPPPSRTMYPRRRHARRPRGPPRRKGPKRSRESRLPPLRQSPHRPLRHTQGPPPPPRRRREGPRRHLDRTPRRILLLIRGTTEVTPRKRTVLRSTRKQEQGGLTTALLFLWPRLSSELL